MVTGQSGVTGEIAQLHVEVARDAASELAPVLHLNTTVDHV